MEASRPIRKTLRPCVDESRNWDTTENLYIEGDNLDVLKLLQESYLGKVKLIYIDPPYNTGHDFIYRDDFARAQAEEEAQMGVFDEETDELLFENLETNGRFHSNWCSMIYPRLLVARSLLASDGLLVISIDDNEINNIRMICNEIFGASNLIAQMVWKSKPQGGNDNKHIVTEHEYVLVYAKDIQNVRIYGKQHTAEKYNKEDEYVAERGKYAAAKLDLSTLEYRINLDYPIECPDGSFVYPGNVSEVEHLRRKNGGNAPRDWQWRWSRERFDKAKQIGLVEYRKNGDKWNVYTKEYERMDYDGNPISRTIKYRTILDFVTTINGTTELNTMLGNRIFPYPKPVELIKMITAMCSSSFDIVLDFFSGSATTAHAVMQLNAEDGGHRKFIMVQLPETCAEGTEAKKAGYQTICDIGKERIRRAGDKIKSEMGLTAQTIDVGFRVLKLADSNMKPVYYAAGEYTQSMLAGLESNIWEDRTDRDLLFSCLLEWGLPLSLPYSSEQISGCTMHTYNDGDLIACFDENVSETVIRAIADRHPLRVVFRDSSFASSPERINVEEIFKLLSPNTSVKVL